MAFLVLSCASQLGTAGKSIGSKIENPCPNNAACNFEIMVGKSMEISDDGTGKPYYQLIENPAKTVYIYKYSEINTDPTIQDAGYREEIIFEADSDSIDFSYQGKQVAISKMMFGVFCFCRGKAGYYNVSGGRITKNGNELSVAIPEIVPGQRTTHFTIK